jgi:hypothetical protein
MFVTWPIETVNQVLEMRGRFTHRQISTITGVSIHTIRLWFYRGPPTRTRTRKLAAPFDRDVLPRPEYSYLLGIYLGDGCITGQSNGSCQLRVVSDEAYPGILDEVTCAMEAVSGGQAWRRRHGEKRAFEISLTWWHWPKAFPQHGPGRKHSRKIELEEWQWEIVRAHTGLFLRGLIHSDGWRGLNRVHVKGKDYAYPRYQFSNRSEDIKRLFCDACDLLGVEWRYWGRYHVSVARRESVAKLDEFVGLKR